MKLNVSNQNEDWTLDWEELFYGAANRFLKSKKKYLVVGFNEMDDFNELFLDKMPNDDFFNEAHDIYGYKMVAVFERNNKKNDLYEPRNSLNYICSYNLSEGELE